MFGGLMRWMGSKADPVPQRREPFIQEPSTVDEFEEYLKAPRILDARFVARTRCREVFDIYLVG